MARKDTDANLAGRHIQMTEGSEKVAHALSRVGGKISLCHMSTNGHIRSGGWHAKVRVDGTTLLVTVLSKSGKQEMRVSQLTQEEAYQALKGLKGFTTKIGN